jgi:hypothetical protein
LPINDRPACREKAFLQGHHQPVEQKASKKPIVRTATMMRPNGSELPFWNSSSELAQARILRQHLGCDQHHRDPREIRSPVKSLAAQRNSDEYLRGQWRGQ